MTNILFLDDNPTRTRAFRSEVPSAVCVETAADCIKLLDEREWDYVFLDHDLGGEEWVGSDREDCGMEVVRWLIANRPQFIRDLNPPKVIVHSHNHPAANEMTFKLRDAGYNVMKVPFIHVVPMIKMGKLL